jgi:GAF domain-containing protein
LAEIEGIRSILCTPLKSKNRIIGALWIFTHKVRSFAQSEINYITTLSNQWGVILGNAKLYQRLHALSEIGKAVTSQLDLQEVLKIIVEKSTLLFGGKGASLLLLRRVEGTLEVAASYGLSKEFLTKGPVLAEESIKECLKHLVIIPDISQSAAVQYPDSLQKEGIRAIICAPLMARGKCIGNLRVYMDLPREFLPEDGELLQLLSDFGGISIENARLFNHIKQEYEDLEQDVWQWYDWGKRSPKL